MDRWEGVLDFCQALDHAVEVDNESELFLDKSVLEVSDISDCYHGRIQLTPST